jgi:hypothetical protein
MQINLHNDDVFFRRFSDDDKTTRAFRLVAILFQDGGRVNNGVFKGK